MRVERKAIESVVYLAGERADVKVEKKAVYLAD